jgi:hypothetical protein
MNYAILSGNTIAAHGPASTLWPDTSFATTGPNASFLTEVGAVLVRSDAAYDPVIEFLQATEPYLLDGEVFDTIAAAIPPPQPDYIGFWDAVLVSDTYAQLLGLAMTNLPVNTALTAFIAAFQDAKAGRANVAAIQACIYLAMQAAAEVLTAEHLAEVQGLMDTYSLSSVYTLTP